MHARSAQETGEWEVPACSGAARPATHLTPLGARFEMAGVSTALAEFDRLISGIVGLDGSCCLHVYSAAQNKVGERSPSTPMAINALRLMPHPVVCYGQIALNPARPKRPVTSTVFLDGIKVQPVLLGVIVWVPYPNLRNA